MWKFLESEMLVILGLTENANRTDAEIGDLYGLKKGTVASIRRRLLDAGAITYVNVPAFNRLGCEMVGVHMGTVEPSERSDARINHYLEFCNKSPQVFQGLIGGSNMVLYTALRNATEYDSFIQTHNKFFASSRRMSKAKLLSTVFPYGLSRGTFAPNFASIVHRHFQLDVPTPKCALPTPVETEPADLSETERLTLVATIENPRASDREVSSIVGLSRQAVTRIRNKLLEEGIFTPACIPRLYKWGFEICAVAHTWFNMELPWEKRLKSQPRECVDLSFYSLSKADESVANYLLAKYTDYSQQLEGILAWYSKMKAFDEKPEITLFPLERCTELRTFDYGPAVRHLLLA
ncbi:MAG: winged helix-turn-helix transcriptional regulator [Thermoplasmatota archaeon]|nr:winged helix-turn-helix transcriptional regulator [Candidatus Thermoplasmatota archaeon]MBU1914662.1 winged helix-turn-helix transcriptional regulator [Candidatus Thermoplasmatota archaeon]